MSIVKQISLKDTELKTFIEALICEYGSRKSAALAISWAFKKVRPNDDLIQYDFPEVILVGKQQLSEGQEFLSERFLGRFIQIQPGIVVFFPGDDLCANDSLRFDFCGIASLTKDLTDNDQFIVHGRQNNSSCHTASLAPNKPERFIFYQYGESYNCTGGRYLIEPEMIEKIKNLF